MKKTLLQWLIGLCLPLGLAAQSPTTPPPPSPQIQSLQDYEDKLDLELQILNLKLRDNPQFQLYVQVTQERQAAERQIAAAKTAAAQPAQQPQKPAATPGK